MRIHEESTCQCTEQNFGNLLICQCIALHLDQCKQFEFTFKVMYKNISNYSNIHLDEYILMV